MLYDVHLIKAMHDGTDPQDFDSNHSFAFTRLKYSFVDIRKLP